MQRVVVLGLVLSLWGCGGQSDAVPTRDGGGADAALPPGPPCPCAAHPVDGACGSTCGNNQIDHCWVQSPMGCHCVTWFDEPCDGTAGLKGCAAYGYYGGQSSCRVCTSEDTSACDPCAPGDASCHAFATTAPLAFEGMSVSGSAVALVTVGDVEIFDGTAEVAHVVTMAPSNAVAVPGGWLVASGDQHTIAPLDPTGQVGAPSALPVAANPLTLSYGPNNRVAVAWTATSGSDHVIHVAILDATGTTVVPDTEVFLAETADPPSVATDGSSFFIGANGTLARIAPDGTHTVTTGFPDQANDIAPTVTWSGSTGWYVNYVGSGFVAQRFDATGSLVGAAIGVPTAREYVADGADLLALEVAAQHVSVVRVDSAGNASPANEVGGGEITSAHVVRFGADLLVGWTRPGYLQVATTAP